MDSGLRRNDGFMGYFQRKMHFAKVSTPFSYGKRKSTKCFQTALTDQLRPSESIYSGLNLNQDKAGSRRQYT